MKKKNVFKTTYGNKCDGSKVSNVAFGLELAIGRILRTKTHLKKN